VVWEEIRIVGLDAKKTQPLDEAEGLRRMFLQISSLPTKEWINIFINERSFPRHNMWRSAWIEGLYIVVDCVPQEIGQYHLRDLKEDVANTNAKYDTYLRLVQAEKQRLQEEKALRRKNLQT
jgi:hypothetical protein